MNFVDRRRHARTAASSAAIPATVDARGGAEIAENYLTSGTPLPLNACRACTRLAGRLSAAVDLTFCDRWNAAIIPEALRVPEWHGPAGGTAAP